MAGETQTTPPKRTPVRSHATQLVKLVRSSGAELFRSPEGDPYATVLVNTHHETMPVESRAFRQYLGRQYFLHTQKGISSSAIKDAANILAGSAMLNGAEHPVFNRIAALDEAIYLDLGRADHEVVKVTATGWEIVAAPDVRFCRRPGSLPLAVPLQTTEPIEPLVRQIINIRDEQNTRLLIAWMVAALRGRKPFPILFVKGESGAAKSTACDLIRRLIDPNQASSSRLPKDVRDLMIAARNSYIISFDNLSHIPDWTSDDLASLATGAGFRTRALTTDTEETIFSAARPILMNGIPDVVTRDDLLSRTITIELEPIDDQHRRTVGDLEHAFSEVQPLLLGRLLDAVTCALRRESSITLPALPRMADLAVTITAAEPALGWSEGTFMRLYAENRQTNTETLLDGHPIYEGVRKLTLPWVGQCEDLLLAIRTDKNKDVLPRTAKGMANALRRLVTPLRQVGYIVTLPKARERAGALRGKRLVSITDAERLTFEAEEEAA